MKSFQRNALFLFAIFFALSQAVPVSIPVALAHDGIDPSLPGTTVPTVPIPPVDQTVPIPTTPTDPHANDPQAVKDEHAAVMELVKLEAVTHRVKTDCTDCKWSDAATWERWDVSSNTWVAGEMPMADANIWIQNGSTVIVDTIDHTAYRTIRVDGLLDFATNVNTGLKVDTMVIAPSGHLRMGSEENPIQGDVEAKIIIADRGEIDLNWDPKELSRGLISHGRVTMHGEKKLEQVTVAETPMRGHKELVLSEAPLNWKVGDALILAGTSASRDQDEQLMITAINGNRVSIVALDDNGDPIQNWRGLEFDYVISESAAQTFVINVSRNVVIESENVGQLGTQTDMGINKRRGHVMIMHSGVGKTHIENAGFYGLGRTDKRTRLENPEFDENGNRKPDTGHNPEGRYALHFHRGGPGNAPAHVSGIAIVDSPGLGLVNHSSNVEVEDAVVYHVVGSAFFTEAGDEKGHFINCSAIRITGSGEGIESRSKMSGVILNPPQDFGHSGHGFWLQSGFKLQNVKVAGAASSGIIFFTEALNQAGLGHVKVLGANVDPAVAMGREHIGVGEVPIELEGALVFASAMGLQTRFHQLNSNHPVHSSIQNVLLVNNKSGMNIDYTRNTDLKNITILGNPNSVWGTAISRNDVTNTILYDNLTIKYFEVGISIPQRGQNVVRGGTFQNVRDIYVTTLMDNNRTVDIEGDIAFLDLTEKQLAGRPKYQIYLKTDFNPKENDITKLFSRDIIRLGTVRYNGKQLYYYAQAADFVPFPADSAASYVPAEFIGKTNQQLWDEYGLAIADAIAPANAIVDEKIHALIGDPANYPPQIKLKSSKYTNQLENYKLAYEIIRPDGTKEMIRVAEPLTLREGWNLYTTTVDGFKRTVMIFGDVTPPSFVPDPKINLTINPADLANGFTVRGTILDNSIGKKHFEKSFKGSDLLALPRLVGADGREYVELRFMVKDPAGNMTEVVLKLVLDPSVPRAAVQVRKDLPPRKVPKILLKLLLGFKPGRLLPLPLAA